MMSNKLILEYSQFKHIITTQFEIPSEGFVTYMIAYSSTRPYNSRANEVY